MSVFITGASSGIGEACARIFAAAKQNLVLVARRKERLETLAVELRSQFGITVHTAVVDVQNRKSIEKLFQEKPEVVKSVNVLINNAGLALGRGPIQLGDPSDWDTTIDTNIKGLLYVTRAFLPQMVDSKKGHIVNLGSAAGHWTYPNGNIYSATKYAVRALTESMRLDLLGTGIRVTEIAPGMVETEFSKVRFKGNDVQAKAVYQGLEALSAKDIAEAVFWCVERPAHVNIQSVVIYPTDQASTQNVFRRT